MKQYSCKRHERPLKRRVEFLYEDDNIIAISKPAGLASIALAGSSEKNVYDIISAHIKKHNPKGRAAIVHRLDKGTSGVMIVAKTAAAKTFFMKNWNDVIDSRTYIALIEGCLPAQKGIFDSYLASDKKKYTMRVVPAKTHGALRAITRYSAIGQGYGKTLVELSLETGRRHQIRAQLAHAGCPVEGDINYGAKTDSLGRLGLHAVSIVIQLQHASPLIITDPPPPDFFKSIGMKNPYN